MRAGPRLRGKRSRSSSESIWKNRRHSRTAPRPFRSRDRQTDGGRSAPRSHHSSTITPRRRDARSDLAQQLEPLVLIGAVQRESGHGSRPAAAIGIREAEATGSWCIAKTTGLGGLLPGHLRDQGRWRRRSRRGLAHCGDQGTRGRPRSGGSHTTCSSRTAMARDDALRGRCAARSLPMAMRTRVVVLVEIEDQAVPGARRPEGGPASQQRGVARTRARRRHRSDCATHRFRSGLRSPPDGRARTVRADTTLQMQGASHRFPAFPSHPLETPHELANDDLFLRCLWPVFRQASTPAARESGTFRRANPARRPGRNRCPGRDGPPRHRRARRRRHHPVPRDVPRRASATDLQLGDPRAACASAASIATADQAIGEMKEKWAALQAAGMVYAEVCCMEVSAALTAPAQ